MNTVERTLRRHDPTWAEQEEQRLRRIRDAARTRYEAKPTLARWHRWVKECDTYWQHVNAQQEIER